LVTNFRQQEILELARKDGKVTVDRLAELYDVTVQTIRRDLSELADSGRLDRVHGGAVIPSGVINIVYEERRRLNEDGKKAIAMACAEAIPDGASVFMNIGTTAEAVARELLDHENLLVGRCRAPIRRRAGRNADRRDDQAVQVRFLGLGMFGD
jgi:DeoR family glycerol-3-phosphate regulon repressor